MQDDETRAIRSAGRRILRHLDRLLEQGAIAYTMLAAGPYPGIRHGLLPVLDDAADRIAAFVRAL